jgi:hypothetical protein
MAFPIFSVGYVINCGASASGWFICRYAHRMGPVPTMMVPCTLARGGSSITHRQYNSFLWPMQCTLGCCLPGKPIGWHCRWSLVHQDEAPEEVTPNTSLDASQEGALAAEGSSGVLLAAPPVGYWLYTELVQSQYKVCIQTILSQYWRIFWKFDKNAF